MCRYAFSGPYKRHFVCFDCRKAFKQPPAEDYFAACGLGNIYRQLIEVWRDPNELAEREHRFGVQLKDLEAQFAAAERKCPDCGHIMVDLGLDLKPPRKTNVRAWKNLQGMYKVGHEWRSCGCNGPGWIPKSTADYQQYLNSTLKRYSESLRIAEQDPDATSAAKHDAGEHWTSRIEAVRAELSALNK